MKREHAGGVQNQLTKFACLSCRKVFKRVVDRSGNRNLPRPIERRTCPNCGAEAFLMGSNFKAPRSDDVARWRIVEQLVRNGLPYFDIGRRYPVKIDEVPQFIDENRDFAQPFA